VRGARGEVFYFFSKEPCTFKIKKPKLKPTRMRVAGIIAVVRISPSIAVVNSGIL
jgi:hypothetical protein